MKTTARKFEGLGLVCFKEPLDFKASIRSSALILAGTIPEPGPEPQVCRQSKSMRHSKSNKCVFNLEHEILLLHDSLHYLLLLPAAEHFLLLCVDLLAVLHCVRIRTKDLQW